MEKVHVSILGMCVLRDIFAIMDEPGNEKYIIDKFVQSVSPIVFSEETCPFFTNSDIKNRIDMLSGEIFKDATNFNKRVMLQNLYGTSEAYLKEIESEYLLLDVGCLRYDIWWSYENDKMYPICPAPPFQKYYKRMKDRGVFPQVQYECISSFDDEKLYAYLDIFVSKLKNMYETNKIILFEEQAVYEYLNEEELFYSKIEETEKFNEIVRKGFEYVRDKLKGCHVVRFPQGVIGDVKHRWGACQYHFIKEYYEYAYKAMDIIIENGDNRLMEEVLLIKLYEETERELLLKYNQKREELHKKMLQTEKVKNRLRKYIDYFEKWILKEKDFNVETGKTVAFYGVTSISAMLLKLCEKKQIEVKYMIEDGMKSYKGLTCFPRNSKELPEVDYLVITDLRTNSIRKNMEKNGIGGGQYCNRYLSAY